MPSVTVLLAAVILHMGSIITTYSKMEEHLQLPGTFKFDPLGLVLLLGAIQFNMITSQLASDNGADWLSTFPSYASASDSIVAPLPGFCLYNLTDKIKALDPAGWFTRWLSTKDVGYVGTVIRVTRKADIKSGLDITGLLSMLMGVVMIAYQLSIATLRRDVYGFIHASCTSIALLGHGLNLYLLRSGLDRMVDEFLPLNTVQNGPYAPHDMCKVWLTMPDGNSVRIEAPCGLVRCLLTTPKPASFTAHTIIRCSCMIATAGQVLTLGQASLPYQVVSIATMVYAYLSDQEPSNKIGSMLDIKIEKSMGDLSHNGVYATIDMDEDQEESMRLWGLMPHASNRRWWETYAKVKAEKTAK